MTKKEILEILRENREFIQKRFSVSRIGLFGSYVTNTQTDESDIDFYVEFKQKSFDNLSGLWVYLEELYDRKIDIIYNHKNSNKTILNQIKKSVIYG